MSMLCTTRCRNLLVLSYFLCTKYISYSFMMVHTVDNYYYNYCCTNMPSFAMKVIEKMFTLHCKLLRLNSPAASLMDPL